MSFSFTGNQNFMLIITVGILVCYFVLPSHVGSFPLRTAGLISVAVAVFCVVYSRLRGQIDLPTWGYGVGVVLIPIILFIARHFAMKGA